MGKIILTRATVEHRHACEKKGVKYEVPSEFGYVARLLNHSEIKRFIALRCLSKMRDTQSKGTIISKVWLNVFTHGRARRFPVGQAKAELFIHGLCSRFSDDFFPLHFGVSQGLIRRRVVAFMSCDFDLCFFVSLF